jgi:hypothetical protein
MPTDPKVVPIIRVGNKATHDKRETTAQKVNTFLGNLEVRVFDSLKEYTVLSVYLDDDGAICVDVEPHRHPLQH